MKYFFNQKWVLFIAAFFAVNVAIAAPSNGAVVNPVTYMKGVADNLLVSLNQNKSKLSNPKIVSAIIYEKVVPYFDVGAMSRLVLGRAFWNKATPAQQIEFQQQFTKMIVGTYAAAIEKYDDDKINFYPLRDGFDKYRLISVSSVVERRNGNKIHVSYNLIRSGNVWRVYDFNIEGISMVSSYRSQFSSVLYQAGVAALIDKLKAHNQAAS